MDNSNTAAAAAAGQHQDVFISVHLESTVM